MADEPTDPTRTGDSYSSDEARKQWADVLNATQWEGKHVTISRGRRRAAVLVPPDWHDRAVDTSDQPVGDSYGSDEARKQWADVLNATQWEGKHVTISRGRRRAAVLVPPDWHDHTVATMAGHRRSPRKRA